MRLNISRTSREAAVSSWVPDGRVPGKRARLEPGGFMVGLCLPAEIAENFNHQLRRNGAKGFGAADFAAQDKVQILAIGRGRFKGMGESMAEIEDFAQPGFAFIAADHFSLGLNAARDHEIESFGVAIRERLE